jgi:hypothetical protein
MVEAFGYIVRACPLSVEPVSTSNGTFRKLAGGTQYLLSRRLCSFRSRKAEGLKLTRDFVRSVILEAVTASSYTQPSVYVVGAGHTLGVWTWDAAALTGALGPSALRQAVPETLCHSPGEGMVIRDCIEGVEGQYWQSGMLLASRWWPEVPTPSEWAVFKRAVGVLNAENDPALPEVMQGLDHRRRPQRNLVPITDQIKQIPAREMGFVFAGLLSVPMVYLLANVASLSFEAWSLETEKARLEEATSGRAQLIREVADIRGQLSSFKGLFRTNDPLSSLEAAVREVAQRGGEVQRLNFQNGELNVRFETKSELAERDFVSALEAKSALTNVTVQRRSAENIWTIDAVATPVSDE